MKKLTQEEFIDRSRKIHGNKYDYSLVEYTLARSNIKIICPIHGVFLQQPNHHLNGIGCRKCGHINRAIKSSKNINIFIKQVNEYHNNKYDYSLVEYKNNKTKVKIICPKHGIFEQTPDNHYKKGCPYCNESKGEKEIAKLLTDRNIQFERQKRFKDCRNRYSLPFDFYIKDKNICIEYDGKQHFVEDYFDGKKGLEYRQQNDAIKTKYCLDNNIKLIRIKYNDNIIKQFIKDKIWQKQDNK
jgi:very-short-patch-repair endonuclease